MHGLKAGCSATRRAPRQRSKSFQTRQALQEAFFGVEADLKCRYRRRLPEGVTGGDVNSP